MNHISGGRTLIVTFSFIAGLLAFITLTAFRMTSRFIDNSRQTSTQSVLLSDIRMTSSLLKDAESGERGYLLTGKNRYLEPYEKAKRLLPVQVADVLKQLEGDPSHKEVVEVPQLIRALFKNYDQAIDVRTRNGLVAALQHLFTGETQRTTEHLQLLMAKLEATHEKQLISYGSRQTGSETSTRVLMGFASVITLATFALAIFIIRRQERGLISSAESAIRASSLKSSFLANMSHEIRTPINGVTGMTDLLLGTKLSREQKDYAETIRKSAQNLLTIINDILDFSKVEAGKMELERIDFDLEELVSDTEKTLRHAVKKKGNTLTVKYQFHTRVFLQGDPGRIRQVLTNLLSNALKFTEKGKVTVTVSKESESSTGMRLRFAVRDSGIGIPPKSLSNLFKPFVQADTSTTRKFGGTGLGLSICKRLVELMGGKIGATSREGHGSEFWFTVPVRKGALLSEKKKDVTKIKGFSKELTQSKILVADDNLINQKVAIKTLEKMGFHADVVSDGKQAVAAIKRKHYDLVLMDCQMPELDGYEATRAIRKIGGESAQIPILAMTAGAVKGEKEKCISAGMNDYVSKPIDLKDFTQKLQTWLTKPTSEPKQKAKHG